MEKNQRSVTDSELTIGFKGFDPKFRCRDKQYTVGNTFEEPKAIPCTCGMHFCQNPLDVLAYYSVFHPKGVGDYNSVSRYATVSASGLAPREADRELAYYEDFESVRVRKDCAKYLTVIKELSIADLADEALSYYYNQTIEVGADELRARYKFSSCRDKSSCVAIADKSYGMAVGTTFGAVAVAAESDSIALTDDINSNAVATASNAIAIASKPNSVASATLEAFVSAAGANSVAVNTGIFGAAEALSPASVAIVTGHHGIVRGVIGSFIGGMREQEDPGDGQLHMELVDGKKIKENTWYHVGEHGLEKVETQEEL